MENLFSGLITFQNKETYKEFINSLDEKTALKIIEMAIHHGQANGLFNLNESHCLYECTKILENKG
jgi:hypothetical protein